MCFTMKPSVFSPGHFRIAPATFSVSGPRFKSVENYFFSSRFFFPLLSLSARLVLAWVQSLAEPTFFLSLFFFSSFLFSLFNISFFPILFFFISSSPFPLLACPPLFFTLSYSFPVLIPPQSFFFFLFPLLSLPLSAAFPPFILFSWFLPFILFSWFLPLFPLLFLSRGFCLFIFPLFIFPSRPLIMFSP